MSNLKEVSDMLNTAIDSAKKAKLYNQKEKIIVARLLLAACLIVFVLLTVQIW